MAFKLPKLPYPYKALEPYIDRQTMKIHHTKHHQGYVDNLNNALKGVRIKFKTPGDVLENINKIPKDRRQVIINNAGGHINHSFFWKIMTPKETKPEGKLLEMLNSKFGSVKEFKDAFSDKAISVFGSGWAFLIVTKGGQVRLKRHSFQNSPVMDGHTPILGIDVWEHAYYLKYQNKKAEYVRAFWNIVNWTQVGDNFKRATVR